MRNGPGIPSRSNPSSSSSLSEKIGSNFTLTVEREEERAKFKFSGRKSGKIT